MKFGILSQWYAPEPGPASLPNVLAQGLRERGHDMQVVTGFPNYPLGRVLDGYHVRPLLDEVRDGVNIRRTALYPSHDSSTLKRLANYGSFAASATLLGVNALRDCDAVWVNYSPITLAAPMLVSRYLQGVPQVTHVLDLWPDTLYASGLSFPGRAGRAADRFLHRWCQTMYAASDSVAYISPGVGNVLAERGVPESKLHYIPMWADESLFRPSDQSLRRELGLPEDAVVILYAGAMGDAQGLETLIEGVRSTPELSYVCLLAGSGTAEPELRRRAEGLSHIRFIGRVPQEQMTALCATADINFVGLRGHESSRITMPSKTQAGLAAGKPLLVSAEGDVAAVARLTDACLVSAPEAEAVAEQIRVACALGRSGLHEMGARARQFYDQHFSARAGIDAIEQLLINAASRRRRKDPARA